MHERKKKLPCQLRPENDPASLYRAMPDKHFMASGGPPFAEASVFALASFAGQVGAAIHSDRKTTTL
jgi:hypothetical protein